MSHLVVEGRSRGWTGRDADRYGHAGGPSRGTSPSTPTFGPELPPGVQGEPPTGTVPALNPDDFWVSVNEYGDTVPARPGDPGAVFDFEGWATANERMRDLAEGASGGGARGPTAAELAIQRAQIQAQNLSTFIDATINQLSAEIEAGRLKTEQAVAEFNRRLDAFSEAGQQFTGLQPFTIPQGVEFVPGFEQDGLATRLGLEPRRASPIMIDPFQMAADIVAGTPNITDIGVPSTDLLEEAVEVARGFI